MKGVIFDFNGTMFFDGALQERSWRLFLSRKTGREITDDEFQQYVHGRNADVSIPYFMGKALTRGEIDVLSEEKEAVYRQLCFERPEAFHLAKGLPEFLDSMKAKGLRMTIATASAINNVRFYFESFGLDRWFDIGLVVCDDGTIPGKPEPAI
jgi:beta-phosphoglucomutase-like phosphatase (HAD superfamily)